MRDKWKHIARLALQFERRRQEEEKREREAALGVDLRECSNEQLNIILR